MIFTGGREITRRKTFPFIDRDGIVIQFSAVSIKGDFDSLLPLCSQCGIPIDSVFIACIIGLIGIFPAGKTISVL